MVNKVFLLGRLGKDPAIKHFSSDNAVAEFPLATSESYKNKDDKWVETTDWHNIKLPNKFMAERAAKSLKKGSLIHLEGKLRNRSYEINGEKRYITEVIVDNFRMLDKKEGGSSESSTSSSQSERHEERQSNTPEDDGLPF